MPLIDQWEFTAVYITQKDILGNLKVGRKFISCLTIYKYSLTKNFPLMNLLFIPAVTWLVQFLVTRRPTFERVLFTGSLNSLVTDIKVVCRAAFLVCFYNSTTKTLISSNLGKKFHIWVGLRANRIQPLTNSQHYFVHSAVLYTLRLITFRSFQCR